MLKWVRAVVLAASLVAGAVACLGDDEAPTDGSPSPALSTSALTSPSPTRSPLPSPSPTATERAVRLEPFGFPLDPTTILGVVEGDVGSRTVAFEADGPTAYDYALNDQPSADPDQANRSGWNCRTHFEYEGIAAVDFYLPVGTPIMATMDGTATLFAISYVNDFDRYGVSREPYLGNPDRARAPYVPFPGPSSGLGVYVTVQNAQFVTEYAHLNLEMTADAVPATAFLDGYSRETDYATRFREIPDPRVATEVARWEVRAWDVVGIGGDAGYSEAPHLHYTVSRAGGAPLCPTREDGFADNGWLFR